MKGLYGRLVLSKYTISFGSINWPRYCTGPVFSLVQSKRGSVLQSDYLVFLLIVLLTAFFVSLLIITRLLKQYIKPIDEATSNAIKLAEGDYSVHTAIIKNERKNDLSLAISSIAQSMRRNFNGTRKRKRTIKYTC